eukprot:TRINITY_DN64003_c0_g1_i1.p1 TRINITY_DN64003_c0_g1~~TRINITY_DN64003_c0_g1_i1.p1  ORF type:complete len:258 (+),score=85.03 TRINITY_DN64003_c0_g1_i1:83-856(+)
MGCHTSKANSKAPVAQAKTLLEGQNQSVEKGSKVDQSNPSTKVKIQESVSTHEIVQDESEYEHNQQATQKNRTAKRKGTPWHGGAAVGPVMNDDDDEEQEEEEEQEVAKSEAEEVVKTAKSDDKDQEKWEVEVFEAKVELVGRKNLESQKSGTDEPSSSSTAITRSIKRKATPWHVAAAGLAAEDDEDEDEEEEESTAEGDANSGKTSKVHLPATPELPELQDTSGAFWSRMTRCLTCQNQCGFAQEASEIQELRLY